MHFAGLATLATLCVVANSSPLPDGARPGPHIIETVPVNATRNATTPRPTKTPKQWHDELVGQPIKPGFMSVEARQVPGDDCFCGLGPCPKLPAHCYKGRFNATGKPKPTPKATKNPVLLPRWKVNTTVAADPSPQPSNAPVSQPDLTNPPSKPCGAADQNCDGHITLHEFWRYLKDTLRNATIKTPKPTATPTPTETKAHNHPVVVNTTEIPVTSRPYRNPKPTPFPVIIPLRPSGPNATSNTTKIHSIKFPKPTRPVYVPFKPSAVTYTRNSTGTRSLKSPGPTSAPLVIRSPKDANRTVERPDNDREAVWRQTLEQMPPAMRYEEYTRWLNLCRHPRGIYMAIPDYKCRVMEEMAKNPPADPNPKPTPTGKPKCHPTSNSRKCDDLPYPPLGSPDLSPRQLNPTNTTGNSTAPRTIKEKQEEYKKRLAQMTSTEYYKEYTAQMALCKRTFDKPGRGSWKCDVLVWMPKPQRPGPMPKPTVYLEPRQLKPTNTTNNSTARPTVRPTARPNIEQMKEEYRKKLEQMTPAEYYEEYQKQERKCDDGIVADPRPPKIPRHWKCDIIMSHMPRPKEPKPTPKPKPTRVPDCRHGDHNCDGVITRTEMMTFPSTELPPSNSTRNNSTGRPTWKEERKLEEQEYRKKLAQMTPAEFYYEYMEQMNRCKPGVWIPNYMLWKCDILRSMPTPEDPNPEPRPKPTKWEDCDPRSWPYKCDGHIWSDDWKKRVQLPPSNLTCNGTVPRSRTDQKKAALYNNWLLQDLTPQERYEEVAKQQKKCFSEAKIPVDRPVLRTPKYICEVVAKISLPTRWQGKPDDKPKVPTCKEGLDPNAKCIPSCKIRQVPWIDKCRRHDDDTEIPKPPVEFVIPVEGEVDE